MTTITNTMVTVTYDGQDIDLAYRPDDAISHILVHAMRLLGITDGTGLSLFTRRGTELPGMRNANMLITPGDQLTLRPRAG